MSIAEHSDRASHHRQPRRAATRRIDICELPGCDWSNPYLSCQDGSRELAACQHARTHEDGAA